MIKRFTFLMLFGALNLSLQAARIYVKADAAGDGTSWTTALGDLQVALEKATNGDEVWVSKGVYFPTTGHNRIISFTIKDGVALYGSFAGSESKIGDRIIEANYTVLSGEIGTTQKTDNTFNVLFTAHATETTIIDGFIITGGYAGGDEASGSRFASGGGLYNDGKNLGNESSPTIRNCKFIENTARDGGAIYNNASNGGKCKPDIENCTFQHNNAFLGGGAVFNNGQMAGNCSVNFSANTFTKNTAGFGGAIFNYGPEGQCISQLKNSLFANNKAMIQGGGIFNLGGAGISKSMLINCEFKDNKAPKGSTVANSQTLVTKKNNTTKL